MNKIVTIKFLIKENEESHDLLKFLEESGLNTEAYYSSGEYILKIKNLSKALQEITEVS